MKKLLLILICVLACLFSKSQSTTRQVNQEITFRLNSLTVINFSGEPSARSSSPAELSLIEKTPQESLNILRKEVFVLKGWLPDLTGSPVQTSKKTLTDNPFYFTSSVLNANRNIVLYTATSH